MERTWWSNLCNALMRALLANRAQERQDRLDRAAAERTRHEPSVPLMCPHGRRAGPGFCPHCLFGR